MSYSIREQMSPQSDVLEFIVLNSAGVLAPTPNTFSSKGKAESRRSALAREEMELEARVRQKKNREDDNTPGW